MKLCVNIDHVATLREARKEGEPDPVQAAIVCELTGAYGITFHLREDRRHIKERDVKLLKELINIKLNMEMANIPEMVRLAKQFQPDQVTLVPEKRQELTTEGGLNVAKYEKDITNTVKELARKNISVSLFIAPEKKQIESSARTGAKCIELHTGEYANAKTEKAIKIELDKLKNSAIYANELGLAVYAGHGLNYRNVQAMSEIPHLEELNIGYSIIGKSVFVGIQKAVKDMLKLINSK
jgi:pyridoxine 5-phosphate synthase